MSGVSNALSTIRGMTPTSTALCAVRALTRPAVRHRQRVKIVTGVDGSSLIAEWSELNIGTAAITARAVDRMGFMDRVVLLDLEGYFSEILRPTIYRNELFAYPVYEPLEVTDIFLHVADGEPLQPLTTAEFRLDKNRVVFNKDLIGMVESNDPNAKVGNLTVSIRYKHYPVYHIIDVDRELMQVREGKPCATRREALTAMPVKVVGRKAEYVFPPMRYGDVPYDNTVK